MTFGRGLLDLALPGPRLRPLRGENLVFTANSPNAVNQGWRYTFFGKN